LNSKKCNKCNETKLLSEFYSYKIKRKNGNTIYYSECKKCNIFRVKNNYDKTQRNEYAKNYRLFKREVYLKNLLKRRIKIRIQALKIYGGENPSCYCCGENKYEFLALDHINDNGNEQRKKSQGGSTALLIWLKKNNWPSGLRVCCYNCNLAREFYGTCPHKVENYKNVTTIESAIARRNPKRKWLGLSRNK
jgi:hypothetical protein